jgi:hypothetical protein
MSLVFLIHGMEIWLALFYSFPDNKPYAYAKQYEQANNKLPFDT